MTQEFLKRLKTQVLYLWEDTNEMYVRSDPENGYYGKFPGSPEFTLSAKSDAVTLALAAADEVSREQYDK